MQTAVTGIWTRVDFSIFYGNNRYDKRASMC